MKTSKVKEVVNFKLHQSSGTIYHNLVMENGEKINIGKKKQLSVGTELTYEIVDEQSGEYMKSKSVQPPFASFGNPAKVEEYNASKNPNPSIQNMIVAQSCISSACNLLQQSQDAHYEKVLFTAAKFYEFVMSKA